MNRNEHLLIHVGEECAEVAQRCSKALRFGLNEVQRDQPDNNQKRILQELNDLIAVVEMLFDCPIEDVINRSEVVAKKEKVEKYLRYSGEVGTLK